MQSTARPNHWLRLALALAVSALVLCVGVAGATQPVSPGAEPSVHARAVELTVAAVTASRLTANLVTPTLYATPRPTRQREVGRRAPRPNTAQLSGAIRASDALLPPARSHDDLAPASNRVHRSGRDGWHRSAPTRAPPRRR